MSEMGKGFALDILRDMGYGRQEAEVRRRGGVSVSQIFQRASAISCSGLAGLGPPANPSAFAGLPAVVRERIEMQRPQAGQLVRPRPYLFRSLANCRESSVRESSRTIARPFFARLYTATHSAESSWRDR